MGPRPKARKVRSVSSPGPDNGGHRYSSIFVEQALGVKKN